MVSGFRFWILCCSCFCGLGCGDFAGLGFAVGLGVCCFQLGGVGALRVLLLGFSFGGFWLLEYLVLFGFVNSRDCLLSWVTLVFVLGLT